MKYLIITLLLFFHGMLCAKEYHVSVKGNDNNTGSETAPFRTIGQATRMAFPGDVITVHAGTYREWVNPLRGGTSNEKRITYRAAAGEHVEIKGSEQVAGWQKEKNGVWKIVLPDTFFNDYNPYKDLIIGDWFYDQGRPHHTGEVFLNNKSLFEVETLEKVMNPVPQEKAKDTKASKYTWYCESDQVNTTIWANFHQYDPNRELVEISVRKTCFYPEKPGINYITVQGFHFSQAATQWAAPTAEQVGMVATHWNKGWIIENNVISNSKCSGITLGKERKTGHNVWSNDRSIDGSLHYIEVTFNALRNGWNKENVGTHIVRNNVIYDCEQTGICGSMGAAFSEIYNNHIYNIWIKRQFDGAEIAGIKFHAAVDTKIERNRIHDTGRGIWLDWMTQGTRVSRNLLYHNDIDDVFIEVNHGPFLIDHNICCSPVSISDWSQGGAYVHNLFTGKIRKRLVLERYTPYFLSHSTDIAGFSIIVGGDNRFLNNLFLPIRPENENIEEVKEQYGTALYNDAKYPMMVNGNVYYNRAIAFTGEENNLILPGFDPEFTIQDKGKEVFISYQVKNLGEVQTRVVTTNLLGKAKLPKQQYEDTNREPLVLDKDYLEQSRNLQPVPGPLEMSENGIISLKVWPIL